MMSSACRFFRPFSGLLVLLVLAGCQGGQSQGGFQYLPLFGNGAKDPTPAIAEVNGIKITARDLDIFLENMPSAQQSKFAGEDGRRLALGRMIDQTLLALGAVENKLYNDPDVAHQLIAQRRITLEKSMRNFGLLRGRDPSEEEIRDFFMDNRAKYRQLGTVKARHIEVMTEADAQLVYKRLTKGGPGNDFPHLVQEFSVNAETAAQEGDVGWFNKGGFVGGIRSPQIFTAKVYDLAAGVNPPVQVGDRWHVVEIRDREFERPSTFAEARGVVLQEMLPGYQDAIIKDYLLDARRKWPVQMFGEFAPGMGMTAEELFSRAIALKNPDEKVEMLDLIHTDFPNSGRADEALFMAAQVVMEASADLRIAERYLSLLIKEYPDSELFDDATFMRDNLYNPEVMNPRSIEDLKQ